MRLISAAASQTAVSTVWPRDVGDAMGWAGVVGGFVFGVRRGDEVHIDPWVVTASVVTVIYMKYTVYYSVFFFHAICCLRPFSLSPFY